MLRYIATAALLPVLLLAVIGVAGAADNDAKSTREREMLRRAQEALRQSQSENSSLAQSKADSEQKLKAAADRLDAVRHSSQSEQSALRNKLKAAADAQTEVTRQLEEARRQIAALTAQQKDVSGQLSGRESQLQQVRQELETSRTANAACETKNLELYEYSQQIVDRYRKKGVWAALSQKEPVLGLGGVRTENVVQEYREKIDGQRLKSSTATPTATPAQPSPPHP
jgi:chromosome segregation ATPase